MAGKRIFVFAVFVLAALALALSARGGAEAQTFKVYNGYVLSSHTPSDSTGTLATIFSIAAPDFNYEDASLTTLNAPDTWSANGLEAPIGAKVGTLTSTVMLGLAGGTCGTPNSPVFDLYNSSVDISVEDPQSNMGWILKANSILIPDTDGDGLPDYMESYPYFLNVLFDPDGSGPLLPLQPRARLAGTTSVAAKNVIIQVLIWNPGQLAAVGGIYAQMNEAKGGPSGSVLNDPVGEIPAPGAISDFCTPLNSTTTLFGVSLDNPATAANEAGYTRQSNPAINTGVLGSQTQITYHYAQSERNSDGDAFETDFDACKFTADPASWNPRISPSCSVGADPGDMDCDMIGVSCDPNDALAQPDIEGDGYSNAQDNCPFVDNGCKTGACGPTFDATWDNQDDRDSGMSDTDLGPKADAIGDTCDDSDDDGNEDGGAAGDCNDGIDNGGADGIDANDPDCVASMDKADWPPAGTAPLDGTYNHSMPWEAECVGGTDADNDGYCAALEALLGSSDSNGPETVCTGTGVGADDDADGYVNDGCAYVGSYAETGTDCLNTTDDDTGADGVANDGCPTIGTPESLVIDSNITGSAALPAPTAYQSCTDGIDNDGDGAVDGADSAGGTQANSSCDTTDYAGDADFDGVPNATILTDNCPSAWNPTQTNTDSAFAATAVFPVGDALGDACDPDDDADNFTDAVENYLPTDPLDRCSNWPSPPLPTNTMRSDTWGLDQDMNRTITVVGDVLKYSGNIGASVTSATPTSWAKSRLDLDGNKTITVVGDVLKYSGKIGGSCTPP